MLQNWEPSLGEAFSLYVNELKERERQESSQDLNRFVQWCGKTTSVVSLTPQTVASYAEWVGLGGGDASRKLEPVKAFLSFLKRKDYVGLSLASHVRIPKGKGRGRGSRGKAPAEKIQLTEEGYQQLTARLETLKGERFKIVADIGRAMADKDFRENAPLDAAKERQGLTESMIRELEETLNSAVVNNQAAAFQSAKVTIGKKITLKDIGSGREVSYVLVHPREANPGDGKLSSESPVGKALLNRRQGEEVQIAVPKGTLTYSIEHIES